jgi:hypothetical protein
MPPKNLANALREVSSYNDLRLQWIRNVEVISAPNSVQINFTTEWPSAPLIQIFTTRPPRSLDPAVVQPTPVAFVLPLFYGWKTGHRARISGLEQKSAYWYRIIAGTEHPKDRPAIAIGRFFTGEREATVDVEVIEVDQSGDAGDWLTNPRGAAEWATYFYVYDKAKGNVLAGARRPVKNFVTVRRGDRVAHPFGPGPFLIPQAPDDIRLYAMVYDDDISDIDLGFTGRGRVDLYQTPMPESPERGANDSTEWASALVDITLDDFVGVDSQKFDLNTGPGHLSYVMRVRLHTTVRNPPPVIWPPLDSLHMRAGLVQERFNTSVPIGGGNKKKVLWLNWAADRQLYYREMDSERLENEQWRGWRKLEGAIAAPFRAFAAEGERFDVVAADPKGGALLASIGDGVPEPKWQPAGGRITASLTAVRAGSGELHLFGLNRERLVEHGVIPRRGKPRWHILGGQEFDGPLTVAEMRGEVVVFAANTRGEVFFRRTSGEAEWEPLGRVEALLSLAAQSADEGRKLVLFAFTTERMVFSKVSNGRKWDPSGERWNSLGLLDEIDGPEPTAERSVKPRPTTKSARHPQSRP